jgi:hypothetical protein
MGKGACHRRLFFLTKMGPGERLIFIFPPENIRFAVIYNI